MARSISEQLGFMTAVVIALLPAVAGLDLLFRGNTTWGLVLLGFAAAVLLVERYVTMPQDAPGIAAAKVVEKVAKDPEADADASDGDEDR